MKSKIAVLFMVLLLAMGCSKKKDKGWLFMLPALSTPSLTNTVETPVTDVAPNAETFQHPVAVAPADSTGTTGSTETTGNTGTTGSTETTGNTGTTGSTETTGNTGTTGSTETTGNTGTTGSTETTGNTGTGTGTGTGSSTGGSDGLVGSDSNPNVAVAHVTESEFKADGIPMTDCVKALPLPAPQGKKVVYDDLSKNICQVQGVWFVVIPWNFNDGNFKMHIEKKIPGAKYLLSALYGTYDVEGYRDLLYPQRFATAPYSPVYNVNYTTQNWLITSQDVFLIDIQKHAWVNFNRNYAFFRIFAGDKDVTNLYGYRKSDRDHGEHYNGKDHEDGDHHTAGKDDDDHGKSKDSDDDEKGHDEYKNGTTIRMTVSNQTYAIDPPPSTISAYLLQSGGIRTTVQTAGLATLALGLVGLIVYLARRKQMA